MTRLQDDILNVYNLLTEFSEKTLMENVPIHIYFDKPLNTVCFEQSGRKISVSVLSYYCKDLKRLDTYILPEKYEEFMTGLTTLIGSGVLIRDRVLLEPITGGFRLYETKSSNFTLGPQLVREIKFIENNSWLYKTIVKFRYKNKL